MTTEIAVLTRKAIVLAADSAVTVGVGEQSKVFNKANKVFALHRRQPVGVMVFNESNFMGVPWETIIKIYRNENSSVEFDKLADYSHHFLKWLENNRTLFPTDLQEKYAELEIRSYCMRIKNDVSERIRFQKRSLKTRKVLYDVIDRHLAKMKHTTWLSPSSLKDQKAACQHYKGQIDKAIQDIFPGVHISKKYIKKLEEILSSIFCKQWHTSGYSGIVIAGFGTQDHFPKLVSYRCAGIYRNITCCTKEKEIDINHNKVAEVEPFGQTEMIYTFLVGIDPDIYELVMHHYRLFDFVFTRFATRLPKQTATTIRGLSNSLHSRFKKELNDQMRDKHMGPIYEMIDLLPKEDLAEFAESIVNITYIKKLMSPHQETVGGPVDVAIISKGDGFIWIKRKHYFESDLNPTYFAKLKTELGV